MSSNVKKLNQVLSKKSTLSSVKGTNVVNRVWDEKNKVGFENVSTYSLNPVFQEKLNQENKRVKKKYSREAKDTLVQPALTHKSQENALDTWVLNKVHPHHYSNILGYRKENIIVNPSVTLQGIRRVLHYLKTIIQLSENPVAPQTSPAELIIVVESSMLSASNSQASSAALISYSLLRLQEFTKLKITTKTAKETISYLASESSKKVNLCGVLILNPAKSILGNLADTLFNQSNKKDKKRSAGKAIGVLCAKKGIPLISLCDVSSPINLYTYPIVCDTRNAKSIYLVLDLLTYGLNRIKV